MPFLYVHPSGVTQRRYFSTSTTVMNRCRYDYNPTHVRVVSLPRPVGNILEPCPTLVHHHIKFPILKRGGCTPFVLRTRMVGISTQFLCNLNFGFGHHPLRRVKCYFHLSLLFRHLYSFSIPKKGYRIHKNENDIPLL